MVYTVVSAPTGQLLVQVSDEDGVIGTSSPVTVTRGADQIGVFTTFTIPQTSTRAYRSRSCRSATSRSPKQAMASSSACPSRHDARAENESASG
jgi:hypothetical protein